MNVKDYVTIQNFDFFSGGDTILGDGHATLSQDFWLIYNCRFRDMQGQAITFHGDVNDSTIDSCTFEYINYLRGGDGVHNGAGGQNTVLTDTTKSFATNSLVGKPLINKSGFASATITSNTATTITTSAGMKNEGGSNINWGTGHKYVVAQGNARGAIYMNGNRLGPGGTLDPADPDTDRNKVLRSTMQFNGNTPIFMFHQDNPEIAYNIILGPNAAFHSNALTHYQSGGGADCEIHHNYINHERVAITFEAVNFLGTGANIYNNIIYTQNNVGYPVSSNGPGNTGTVRILNNVLMGGVDFSIGFLGPDNFGPVIVRNNILSVPFRL